MSLIMQPEQFMKAVENFPAKDREELNRVWEDIFQDVLRQKLDYSTKLRYAIAKSYLQAVYDEVLTSQVSRMKSRIIV